MNLKLSEICPTSFLVILSTIQSRKFNRNKGTVITSKSCNYFAENTTSLFHHFDLTELEAFSVHN